MKFEKALAAMREGKKVRLSTWVDKSDHVCIADDQILFPSGRDFEVCSMFALSDDWEIYEEPKKPLTFYEAIKISRDGGACVNGDGYESKMTMRLRTGMLVFVYDNGDIQTSVSLSEINSKWYEV